MPDREPSKEGLLKGKVAIVTGGASGIGLATALELYKEGAQVAVFDNNPVVPRKFLNTGIRFHLIDIRGEYAVEAAVKNVEADFGPITTLANIAGVTQPSTTIDEETVEDWQRVIDTNLTGQFKVTKHVLARMKESQTKGSIIFITSVHDSIGYVGYPAYNVTKAGLLNFMRTVALEGGPYGIRANAIAPGAIDPTGMSKMTEKQREGFAKSIPLRRIGAPQDIANVVAFLASDKSDYITGARIPVDGGTSEAPSLRQI